MDIKLLARRQDSGRVQVSVHFRNALGEWRWTGTLSLTSDEWSMFKSCIAIGAGGRYGLLVEVEG